tara:strand:+ start:33 stop:707 length:675 start_codon:yes stop_codon:yes gene_type:complete
MKYKELLMTKVKPSKFNPTVRTDKNSTKYKALRKNIETNGLIVPIVLSKNLTIIDGHRRFYCLKDLGIKKVPATIHETVTNRNYDKMFVAANENSMTITAAQEVERYLNGAAISEKTKKVIKELETIGGRKFIKRIASAHKSPLTYFIALNQFKSYTKKTTRLMARKVVYWMLNIGSAYQLKSAMADFIPVDILLDAITSRKSIVKEWYNHTTTTNSDRTSLVI